MPGVTIVAGASSGIGRDLALQLARSGECLHLIGYDPGRVEEIAELCRQRGAQASGHTLDLKQFDRVEEWYQGLVNGGAEVNAFYHCAARSTFGEIKDHSLEDIEWVYRTNLLSVGQWMSLLYPSMARRKSGTIVLMSSLSAYSGFPMVTPYAATKQGIVGLGRSMWVEAKRDGVGLHIVCPGFVTSRIFEAGRYRQTNYDAVMESVRKLGFPFISSEKAARAILRGVRKKKKLIVFPFYARVMGLLGFRAPWIVDIFHRKTIRRLAKVEPPAPHPSQVTDV